MRYSEILVIHENLSKNTKNLPTFPKKKIFGITNDDKNEVKKRQ
jgi:hypothetical protein